MRHMNKTMIILATAMLSLSTLAIVPTASAHDCSSQGLQPDPNCNPTYCFEGQEHDHEFYLPGGVLWQACESNKLVAVASSTNL